MSGRRKFLKGVAGGLAWSARTAPLGAKPRLGVVVSVADGRTDAAIARVKALGLAGCQVHVGAMPEMALAKPLRTALDKYGVEATAVMTLGPGRMVWNFYEGPSTIGLVPPGTRAARTEALRRASDLAKACGIGAVHTHCGFIPEDPNDKLYEQTVEAIRAVAAHCGENGQTFLMETGQETPVTLLRAMTDVGLENVGANLDTANLILYGKGDPGAALEVIGRRVRGLHAKDGRYPTDPRELGKEVAIGQGEVDFGAVMRKLHGLGYTGPITIEREIEGERQGRDIAESAGYLRKLVDQIWG